ncbi:unnamed protein product [Rhodiola kirilowii]
MFDHQVSRPSYNYKESLKLLEADIQHANMLAASIPLAKGGVRFQMKLAYNQLAPLFLLLFRWMDSSCICLLPSYLNLFHVVVYKVKPNGSTSRTSYGRKATIREFYAVILPSLQRLHSSSLDLSNAQEKRRSMEMFIGRRVEDKMKSIDAELEREDECGICLEPCTKIVLPNCCHAMCINCYHDWNMKSESCPFCRGSIKRVKSADLWVLTCNSDVVDTMTAWKEDMSQFYLYLNNLPKDIPDALFLVYYEYLM